MSGINLSLSQEAKEGVGKGAGGARGAPSEEEEEEEGAGMHSEGTNPTSVRGGDPCSYPKNSVGLKPMA